jgi:uncharacterized membrane protein
LAVVTTGIALSATYSSAEALPLPMVLVGLLVSVFLLLEARRYRYFNVWRGRARFDIDQQFPIQARLRFNALLISGVACHHFTIFKFRAVSVPRR